jgi:hypothetical protein
MPSDHTHGEKKKYVKQKAKSKQSIAIQSPTQRQP